MCSGSVCRKGLRMRMFAGQSGSPRMRACSLGSGGRPQALGRGVLTVSAMGN